MRGASDRSARHARQPVAARSPRTPTRRMLMHIALAGLAGLVTMAAFTMLAGLEAARHRRHRPTPAAEIELALPIWLVQTPAFAWALRRRR